MNIVVLDGHTLNPGDLSWDAVCKFGDVTVFDHTNTEDIVSRSSGADIVLTNKTPLTAESLRQLPRLKYIGVLATGYNVVDVACAQERNIIVTNIPTYGTHSVAQTVFALILELCHHTFEHNVAAKSGRWSQSKDFCFWDYPLIELNEKTIGIIGFGRIGQRVADIAEAFGMSVLAYDEYKTDQSFRGNFQWANSLDDLLKTSDIVSLHCPLLDNTKGVINARTLGLMKHSAFLVNASRGPLIVENDLANALNDGTIAGAALDVLSTEPPSQDNPLLSAKNCLITPHIAWATREARSRLMNIAADNIRAWTAGTPANVVLPT